MEITIIPTTFLCLIIILGNVKITESQEHLPEKQVIPVENELVEEHTNNDQSTSRVKRQFGFYPYDPYYPPRPVPIIVGVGGFGIGGFGGGFGRGFGGRGFGGFGGRGFGGRGFGGRGFGGRVFGGRGFGGGRGGFGGRGRG